MRFDRLLRIYWSRNFLYGGKTFTFASSSHDFLYNLSGFSHKSKFLLLKRFELNTFLHQPFKLFSLLSLDQRKIINMYLSRLTSVNYNFIEMLKFNLIRLYLIKTFRGKCHALGKPSRGQRTWSNAWTAFKIVSITKNFISEIKKMNVVKKNPIKIDYRITRGKPVKKIKQKFKMIKIDKKLNVWF